MSGCRAWTPKAETAAAYWVTINKKVQIQGQSLGRSNPRNSRDPSKRERLTVDHEARAQRALFARGRRYGDFELSRFDYTPLVRIHQGQAILRNGQADRASFTCGQGNPCEGDQDLVHPGHRRHQIAAIYLGDLRPLARAAIVKLEAEFQRFTQGEP